MKRENVSQKLTLGCFGGIAGIGTTNINGVNLNSKPDTSITQNKLNITSGALLIENANNLIISDTTTGIHIDGETSQLTFNGGNNTNKITGTGTTVIDGDVISHSLIGTAMTVNSGKSLTIGAGNVGGAVANNGTLYLVSGTFNKIVNGTGMSNITGNVVWETGAGLTNTTIDTAGSLDIGTNTVTLGDTLINGALKMEITDIAKDSATYTGGKLNVGNLDLGSDSKLSLTVAANKLQRNETTEELSLINASDAVTGDFASMLSNNRYTVENGSSFGKYKITYTTSVEDIVNEGAGNQNNINAGNAWYVLAVTGNPSTDTVQSKLNDLSQ